MIVRLPRDFLFPLAVAAFIGVTIRYFNTIFTGNTRWVFLAVLGIYLLITRRVLLGLQSWFGMVLAVYCMWCIVTTSWSVAPELSLLKSIALPLVAFSFLTAGYCWVFSRSSMSALNCFIPVAAMTLFAGLVGVNDYGSFTRQVGGLLYEGLAGNPNMLGSLLAMTIPLLLWMAYRYRGTTWKKWLSFSLLGLAVLLLIRTHARSSILDAGVCVVAFCFSFKLRKTTIFLANIAAALLCAAVLATTVIDATGIYLLKGGPAAEGILSSRADVWQESYENAEQGGWFGIGYGATVGATDSDFEGGLNAVSYGREKGNSQLGIVEETGLVGLGLYAILLTLLFSRLVAAHRRATGDMKVLLGIIIGSLAGFIVMSIFECWWDAPGGAESAYFWSAAGVALGLAQVSLAAAKAPQPQPLIQQPSLAPVGVPSQRIGG